ncbi:MAG: RelA/SpoT domain-containing protein [Deltaproteobacteria bacterium]|nr:RelA/SpoT domain-containing protein [Deltaproteobacteria bacterium]
MAFPKPQFSRTQVDRAGQTLLANHEDQKASVILTNWRASHGYPVNTFQATLRLRLRNIDPKALVAQRIKRTPAILSKLKRFNSMRLSQMQDIGGLRAVVDSVKHVRMLQKLYSDHKLDHQMVYVDDYIEHPKDDGYRSVHMIYRYKNRNENAYDGLFVELQIRTRLQHAWATAVETMGTFLGQALKSREGEKRWLDFFAVAGAAFCHREKTVMIPGYQDFTSRDTYQAVADAENKLNVLYKLQGFAVAADAISKSNVRGRYNLIILDSLNKKVSITSFAKNQLEKATEEYAKVESRAIAGDKIEAVLVSAGPIDALRKAYPNYFLDTRAFISIMHQIIAEGKK